MDWLKLFALLVAVASVQITADGPKKKIRIHLPQKVKHIHHHKKIYITNHPAPSQYAPAFLPGVKGGVALPSNVARPAVASILPLNSVELYDDVRPRLPPISPAASKLLPLYRARGHYGPNHSEWEEHDYDLAPPPEPSDIYSSPSAYSAPGATAPAPVPTIPSKKIKIVKVSDLPRKKVVRKVKPKRIIVRPRPLPLPQPVQAQAEDEHPVSSFHEQFYSDLEEGGTIRKIKKPPRIEKIIDGDTEHIHTYSEEHIHKVVFDDDSKVTGVVGVDPIGSMSALNTAHPLVPLKNAQSLLAIPTNSFADLAVMGSMGTPSHLEYAAYNPRDVTHDHVFHDHGEIPPGIDITKDPLRLPPKASFNSQGYRVTGDPTKRHPGKRLKNKPTKPTYDLSYYESIYAQSHGPKRYPRPTNPTPYYDISPSGNANDYKPVPALGFKEKRKTKTRNNYGYGKQVPNFHLQQQASVPAPFSVSSTVVHNYDPKGYSGPGPIPTGFSKFRDSLIDFKDSGSYSNEFDYDTFASSSNIHTSEDKNDSNMSHHGRPAKKSVSTQNISFGGQDSQTFVDHLAVAASSNSEVSISDAPTALDDIADFESDSPSPTPYTIKETSPAHQYYSAMAMKALHGEQHEASNDNLQYAEPPTPSEEPTESPLATTTSQAIQFYKIQSTDAIPEPEYFTETRQPKRRREKNKGEQRQKFFKQLMSGYVEGGEEEAQGARQRDKFFRTTDSSSVRGNPKYGDKI